jgi:F0F1-type ATP synthase membrane subunit c/vacuolar-type H+-ATPase subunit K
MEFVTSVAPVALFLGAAFSTAMAAINSGLGQGLTASSTIKALQRQPKSGDVLLRSMLISQAITESGGIFGLVISLLLLFGGFAGVDGLDVDWARAASLLAAGIAMGFGTMGPNLGSGITGALACEGIGRVPSQTMPVTLNMMIGQALCQTSAIFALVVALLLMYTIPPLQEVTSLGHQIAKSFAFIGAAISIGFGTTGPATGIGIAGGEASLGIAKNKDYQSHLMRTMFLGAAVTESSAIYALVIAFLLVFV